MLSDAEEREYVTQRIDHDAFADTRGFGKPMDISIPATAWPAGMKPVVHKIGSQAPGTTISTAAEKADVLIITYTTDETRALSAVMTGNRNFETSWYSYTHLFDSIKPKITEGLILKGKPTTLGKGTLCFLLPVTINNKKVMLCKSELHPAHNGKHLPFIDLIKQLVSEIQPKLVLTAGTGGAVGSHVKCGDVVVTDTALFHCKHTYPDYPQIPNITSGATQTPLSNTVTVNHGQVTYANQNLTKLVAPGLSMDIDKLKTGKFNITYVPVNPSPKIWVNKVTGAAAMNVLSADYFSVDDTHDTEGLEKLGVMDDMDDAFVALAIQQSPVAAKPQWLSVRNASEPQMPYNPVEKTLKDQADAIYSTCGYHTSMIGAFACWAIVAGM